MFEHMKKFSSIAVTGPQRSGTRIVSKMIAHDLKKQYVDERQVNDEDFRLLEWYLYKGGNVVQCPALMHVITDISTPNSLVVIVSRSIDDIVASEDRIGWPWISKKREYEKYGNPAGIISQIKYSHFNNVQKAMLIEKAIPFTIVKYDTLDKHPLFISKEKRANFKWNETI